MAKRSPKIFQLITAALSLGIFLFILSAVPVPKPALANHPTMKLYGWNDAPGSFAVPPTGASKLVSMLQLRPRAASDTVLWTWLTVDSIGTAATSTIDGVRIYRSTDTAFDPATDSTIAAQGSVGNPIKFDTTQTITSTNTTNYFVVFNIDTSTAIGKTIGARIANESYVIVNAPATVDELRNLDSKMSTIIGRPHGTPGTPGFGDTNYCSACHSVHMARANRRVLNKLFTKEPAVVNNNSDTVYNALCYSCHDGTGSQYNIKQDYEGTGTAQQKGANVVSPGHMTDQPGTNTVGYLSDTTYTARVKLPCMVCHDVHTSKWGNAKMLADALYEYASSADQTTDTTTATYYWDSSAAVWATPESSMTTYARRKRCEVCHRNHAGTSDTSTSPGSGSWVDGKSIVIGIDLGRPGSHNDGVRDVSWCGGCHGVHKITVPVMSESAGDTDCSTCHSDAIVNPMKDDPNSYHHVMMNSGVDGLTGTDTKYPTDSQFESSETSSSQRRCLQCHADHDVWSPATGDSTPNGSRAKNLRVSIDVTPTASNTLTYSDRDYVESTSTGGICLSCHQNTQTKNTNKQRFLAGQDNTGTMVVTKAQFFDTTTGHNYEVTSTFAGRTGDNTTSGSFTYRANCVKCHNAMDDIYYPYDPDPNAFRSKQNSLYRFNLHQTKARRLLAWLSIRPQDETTEPLEESFCIRCHSRAYNPNGGGTGSGNDYYGRSFMTTSALDIEAQFNKTSFHPVRSTKGKHKAVEGESSNWNPASDRHVECEDCHNPHAAKRFNSSDTVRGSPQGGDIRGPNRGTWGVTVSGYDLVNTGTVTFTDNSTSVVGVGTTWLSAPAVGPGWYIKNNWDVRGRWYKIRNVTSNTQLYLETPYDGSNFSSGFAGTLDFTAVDYVISTVTVSRTAAVTRVYELCLKCHSMYAFDSVPATSTQGGTANGSAVKETDIMLDFNPKQYAFHPVMAIGKNQPISPTGTTTSTSWWNTNWPRFTSGQVSITTGTPAIAIFTTATPSTVIPGWYLKYGTSAAPPNGTNQIDWYQVTKVTSSTVMEVTPTPNSAKPNAAFSLTAGLGNVFVPPYGPWSIISCADCHRGSQNDEPAGPHGSNQRWLLREATSNITFNWYTGSSVISVNSAYGDGSQVSPAWDNTYSKNVFCFNCHRRDAYGDISDRNSGAGFDNPNTASVVESQMSRVPHDVTGDNRTYDWYTDTTHRNRWGVVCRHCHGGSATGGLHGSAAKIGVNGTGFRGKRFLNGATWEGVTRATVSASVQCWTKAAADEVSTCQPGHGGSSGVTAIYDYDAGSD